MRQCWPAVSVANRMWGGLRVFSGPQYFYSAALDVKSFCTHCLCLYFCQRLFAPSPSLALGDLVSIWKLSTEVLSVIVPVVDIGALRVQPTNSELTRYSVVAWLTVPQLVPATNADISPPSFLAAVIALSVMGPTVLLSCSAITSVDALLFETKSRKEFPCI